LCLPDTIYFNLKELKMKKIFAILALAVSGTAFAAGSDYSLTLPANAGSSGQVLTTDGAGNLSFTSVGGVQTSIANGTTNVVTSATTVSMGVEGLPNGVVVSKSGADLSVLTMSTDAGSQIVLQNKTTGKGQTLTADGNITAEGTANLSLIAANTRLSVNSNSSITMSANNSANLTFDTTGNLSVPNSVTANAVFTKLTNTTVSTTATIAQQLTFVNAAANVTLTMPAAGAETIGQVYYIKDILGANRTGNTITILGAGSDTIDGGNVQIISPYNSATIVGVTATSWGIL
jgi:hypothetical protein